MLLLLGNGEVDRWFRGGLLFEEMAREEDHITVMEANHLDQSAASNNNEPSATTRRRSLDAVLLIPEEGCAKAAVPLQQMKIDEIITTKERCRRYRSGGRPVLGVGCTFFYIMMIIILSLLHQTSDAASTDMDHKSRRVQTASPFVCSPMTYNFTLNLSRNCDTDTMNDNPGISETVCSLLNADDVDTSSLNVFEVGFLEAESSLSSVISQEIRRVDLADGDTISFDSVSKKLNSALYPNEALTEQLESVPEAVILTIKARSEDGTVVTNRVAWTYSFVAGSLPVSVGDSIAWITLVSCCTQLWTLVCSLVFATLDVQL